MEDFIKKFMEKVIPYSPGDYMNLLKDKYEFLKRPLDDIYMYINAVEFVEALAPYRDPVTLESIEKIAKDLEKRGIDVYEGLYAIGLITFYDFEITHNRDTANRLKSIIIYMAYLAENAHPVKCAWCGKTIRMVTYEDSHGICNDCSQKLLSKYKKT